MGEYRLRLPFSRPPAAEGKIKERADRMRSDVLIAVATQKANLRLSIHGQSCGDKPRCTFPRVVYKLLEEKNPWEVFTALAMQPDARPIRYYVSLPARKGKTKWKARNEKPETNH